MKTILEKNDLWRLFAVLVVPAFALIAQKVVQSAPLSGYLTAGAYGLAASGILIFLLVAFGGVGRKEP